MDGLRRGERLAPRILATGRGAVQACLLQTQAGPLAGDHDRVRIEVGAHATLLLRPIAATLALPGAARTRLALEIDDGPVLHDALRFDPLDAACGTPPHPLNRLPNYGASSKFFRLE